MGEEKVTMMVLKVDLKCRKCYRKVKKVLCKFPQIRDQVYDEKTDSVIIKVVCCSPEKIKEKIICKGGESIKSIEIVVPKPPPEKPKPPAEKPPKGAEKSPEKEKPKEKEKLDKPVEQVKPKESEKPKEKEKPKQDDKPKKPDQPPPAPAPTPVAVCPPAGIPVGVCCPECYHGIPGGPCFRGGPPPCYQYDGYYGRPVYDSYGGGRGYWVSSSCHDYFSEENTSGCTVM